MYRTPNCIFCDDIPKMASLAAEMVRKSLQSRNR